MVITSHDLRTIADVADRANTTSHLALLKSRYATETSKILDAQRDSHKAITSCTKVLQNVGALWFKLMQKFKSDPSTVTSSDVFEGKDKEINATIAMHLIRQGQFELAATFIQVSKSASGVLTDRNPVSRSLQTCRPNSEKCTRYCKR